MTLKLEIVTPEAKTFSDDVDQVVIPGSEGEFGVLPGHEHLITRMHSGELTIFQNGTQKYLAVGEGFIEVRSDRVSILTDMAMNPEQINEQEAENARKRAEDALNNPELTGGDRKVHVAHLRRSIALLNVKRRRM